MKHVRRCISLSLSLAMMLAMVLSLIPNLMFTQNKTGFAAGTAGSSLISEARQMSPTIGAHRLMHVLETEHEAEGTVVRSPSGIRYDARVSSRILTTGKTGETGGSGTRSAVVRFTLEHPGEQLVSFRYTAVSGSANTSRHLTGTLSGTVSLSHAKPEMDITIGIAPSPDKPGEYGLPDDPDAFWTGERVFYLFCDNIQNALFHGNRNSLTIPVPIQSEFDYAAAYANAASTRLVDLDDLCGASSPGVYPVPESEIPESRQLRLTAGISEDVRKMLDAGVFTHIQLPEGYFQKAGGAEGSISYKVAASHSLDGSYAWDVLGQSITLSETGQTPFYSEFFPQEQPISAVNLGPCREANGIFRRLDFIFDYSGVIGPVDTCFLDAEGQYVRSQVNFSDQAAPTVNPIATGASATESPIVRCGNQVPVIINFSEPVYTDNITFEVGGKILHPVESTGTISESISFLYAVGDEALDAEFIDINVTDIDGAVDLSGKAQEEAALGSARASLSSFDAVQTLTYCAEPSVTLDQGTSRTAEATVSIPLKRSLDLGNWLVDSSRLVEEDVSIAVKAKAITEGGSVDIPLTIQKDTIYVTALTGHFTAPENMTGQDERYALEIYMDANDEGNFSMVYGLTTAYAVPPLILIEDESDLTFDYGNWPPGNSVFADAGTNLALGYTLNVAATWQGGGYFAWSSSNEGIASIDASGNIMLTGAAGTVSFTLTVTNPLSDDSVLFESRILTVHEAEGAYLYVPNGLKNQDILLGGGARISFSSNLCQRNGLYGGIGTETVYRFALYAANYEGDLLEKGNRLNVETLSATADAPMTSYALSGGLLTNVTERGRHGYILEISAKDIQSGQVYTAQANIRVRALPAAAVLVRPDTAFLTDHKDSFDLRFDIRNRNAETEYLLTVTKNSQGDPVLAASAPEHIGETLTVDVDSVGESRLLDVYTVSLKAKNGSDETWSYDSYCVYVYNSRAMRLLLNGFPAPGTLTMKADFEDGDVVYGTHLLLKSRWGLGLAELVSVDGKAYPWSAMADRITWRVDGESVSLWYGSGGSARRIGDDYNPVLLPGADLWLHGDGTGNSVITAAHTLTGMTASMGVTVKPLNDKLYLFQTYPQVSCEIVYTNGRGTETTVSAPSGEVGVYEESGIAGDVVICPKDGAEAVFDFAVLDHGALMANQKSSGSFDLYPMNTVKLPRINYNVSLQIFDETSGEPYTGDIVIRGGVYLNGVYQPATTINGSMGNADQSVRTDSQGRYRLAFRPADFANRLRASDRLQYVIEVSFADNSHLTRYIKVENDAIQAGKTSPLGVCLSAGIQPLDASAIQNHAVVLSETLTVNGEEKPMSELLYLEEVPESAILEMTAMIPGDSRLYYRLHLKNSAGCPDGSSNVADVKEAYPFSDTVTLHFSHDIRSALWYAMKYGVKPGERTDFYPVIRSTDGSTEIKLSKPIQVLSLLGIPKMSSLRYGETDYTNILSLITDMSSGSENLSFSDSDDAVKDALDVLKDYATYSATMGLEVQSTDDPLVYKGIIRFAAGSYSKDNPSGVFVGSGEKTRFKFLPGVSDVKAMAKGTFLRKAKEEMNRLGYKSYGGGAYLDCEVFYSIEEQQWKVRLLTGDVYLGGGGGYRRHYNGWVSFVPVTATFNTSLTAELGLTILRSPSRDFTAYIPRLRPVFSIYGFGGFGRDYEVVALKAGVYGFAQHEQLYLWYRDTDGQTADGQRLKISGEVGVEYAIKLLFVELKGKYALTKASKSWKYSDFDYINDKMPTELRFASLFSIDGSEDAYILALVPVEESVSLEDRSYLEAYHRSWGVSSSMGLLALPSGEGLADIWTNAYPYAAPSVSNDGAMMVYLSDMDSEDIADTAACFTAKNGAGAFPDGTEIDASAYPDSSLSLSGTSSGASAVWVRTFADVGGMAGSEAAAEDAVNALAASEIMAGVYDGEAFAVTRLTDNHNPDLSPVTAASGNKAIVAWRSVNLGHLDNPLDFTSDYITYAVYDGSDWSEAKCLYDGSVDAVSTLNAAMLSNGTSAVVYQIREADGGDSEIICAVLGTAGEVVQTLRLTDNATQDENPQITVAEFPDGKSRFVIGWNSETGSGESAVRLVALNADGTLYPELALELSDTVSPSNYADFRFTKGAEKLEDLSVIWAESGDSNGDSTYEDTIFGAKILTTSDGSISMSGKLKLLALDEGRAVDSLDAWVDLGTGKVHCALLVGEPSGSATLSTAVAQYQNTLTLDEPYFEHADLLPGLDLPVRFTVVNDGIEPITNITIALGDQTYEYEDEAIVPGETKSFFVSYQVPDNIVNADYTVTAKFGNRDDTDSKSGSVKFALPDVGIYRIDLTKETQRERAFRVLLQNNAYADLRESTHSVRLEVWDTPDCKTGSPVKTLTVSDDDFDILNDSLLSLDINLTETDLRAFLDENGEIPQAGAWVFFRAVLAEGGKDTEDADSSNDMDYVKVRSLVHKNGSAISLASLSQTADDKTTVRVEVFNNSMNPVSNGNLVVTLRDEEGNVLETKETHDPRDNGSLLSIAGEESLAITLPFSRNGYTADVTFARISGESTRLSALNMTGVPLKFDSNVHEYDVQTYGLTQIYLNAVAENPASVVSVLKNGTSVSVSGPVSLSYGTNVFVITVTTGETINTYTVTVQNSRIDGGTDPGGDHSASDETSDDYYAELTIGRVKRSNLSIKLIGGRAVVSLGSMAHEIFSGDTEAILTMPPFSAQMAIRWKCLPILSPVRTQGPPSRFRPSWAASAFRLGCWRERRDSRRQRT